MGSPKVKALVSGLSAEESKLLARRLRRTQITNTGKLAVRLSANRSLSHKTYPSQWKDAGPRVPKVFRYLRDFAAGVVRTVYDFPEELAGTEYRLAIEGDEGNLPHYYQVITGYNGERLRPYRRVKGEHISSLFAAPQMGMLRINNEAVGEARRLTICRTRLEVGGLVVVTEERLYNRTDPWSAAPCPPLPADLADWELALQALQERMKCMSPTCDGHYHLP